MYVRCPRCKEDSRVPAMCLVCGEIVCSQSYCCQTEIDGMMVGAATLHADVCGAGTGIFLRFMSLLTCQSVDVFVRLNSLLVTPKVNS